VGVVLSLLTDNIYQQTTFADSYIFLDRYFTSKYHFFRQKIC
jgi:hypothetical protein